MKVAYVFVNPRSASYKLGRMILTQLEAGTHEIEHSRQCVQNGLIERRDVVLLDGAANRCREIVVRLAQQFRETLRLTVAEPSV